jgi:hypothetical protein
MHHWENSKTWKNSPILSESTPLQPVSQNWQTQDVLSINEHCRIISVGVVRPMMALFIKSAIAFDAREANKIEGDGGPTKHRSSDQRQS